MRLVLPGQPEPAAGFSGAGVQDYKQLQCLGQRRRGRRVPFRQPQRERVEHDVDRARWVGTGWRGPGGLAASRTPPGRSKSPATNAAPSTSRCISRATRHRAAQAAWPRAAAAGLRRCRGIGQRRSGRASSPSPRPGAGPAVRPAPRPAAPAPHPAPRPRVWPGPRPPLRPAAGSGVSSAARSKNAAASETASGANASLRPAVVFALGLGWYGETDQWLAYHTWLLEPRDEGTTYVVMEETGSGLNPKTLGLQSRPHAPRSRPVEHQPQVPLRKHPAVAATERQHPQLAGSRQAQPSRRPDRDAG